MTYLYGRERTHIKSIDAFGLDEEQSTAVNIRTLYSGDGLLPVIILPKAWQKAEEIVKFIDPNDIDLVALTRHLKNGLWKGDKKLYEGLKLQKLCCKLP